MDCVAEVNDIAQKIWPVAEAFENTWHLLPPRLLAPLLVDFGHIACGIGIFDQSNFCFKVRHCPTFQRSDTWGNIPCKRFGRIHLKDEADIPLFTGDSFPVQVFEQWDGIFSGESGYLFKVGNIHLLTPHFQQFGA